MDISYAHITTLTVDISSALVEILYYRQVTLSTSIYQSCASILYVNKKEVRYVYMRCVYGQRSIIASVRALEKGSS